MAGQNEASIVGQWLLAQLVEQLPSTPEVRSLKPVIGIVFYITFVYCQQYWKAEIKENEARNAP